MCASASGRSYADTLGAIADLAIARGRMAPPDPGKIAQPSDTLLKEFVQQKKAGDPAGDPPGEGKAGDPSVVRASAAPDESVEKNDTPAGT
jgi:hypothetical protein